VFAACSGQAAIDLVNAYRAARIKTPLYGPGSLTEGAVSTGTLMDEESTNALGVFTAMDYAPNLDNPQNQAFAAAYYTATHPSIAPTTLAMTTYDAATVLDTVVPLIHSEVTRENLAAALRSRAQFPSPRGPWEFNDQSTPRQHWYLREVQRDGMVMLNLVVQAIDMLN
jgi:branched-chain amino acid transport system substrate-binding protein